MQKKIYLSLFVFCFLFLAGREVYAMGITDGPVFATVVQPDGRVVIGGWLENYNSTSRNGIARINTNGTIDTSFDPGAGTDGDAVRAIARQSDGKILIGGEFTTYDGVSRKYIARINVDGTLDTTFDPGVGPNNFYIRAIAVQTDGKIVIGGDFTTYGGVARNGVARINADGTLDTSFIVGMGANDEVHAITIRSDNKIVIGGTFTTYNGVNRNRVAVLNTDGSVDLAFNPGSGSYDGNGVEAVAVQSDGKILVGGNFWNFNGSDIDHFVRLNVDGSVDTAFDRNFSGIYVAGITIQSDGKILIGGYFSSYDDVARNNFARINTDGSIDTTYGEDIGISSDNIKCIATQTDGKVIIGGEYFSLEADYGTYRSDIARIGVDGSNDNDFFPLVVISTQPVTDVTPYTAIGHGTIINSGGESVERLIEWDQWGSYMNSCTAGIGTENTFSCTMTGLQPNTTYHVRSRAINSVGDVYDSDTLTFTTPSDVLTVVTDVAADITDISATANAHIVATGGNDPLREVEWGVTSGVYGYSCSAGVGGTGPYTCAMTGLSEDTTYFARAKATNNSGVVYGDEIIFTTSSSGGLNPTHTQSLSVTIQETITLNCGGDVDLDNGTILTAGTPQTNSTTCQVTTNDQDGYTLSLTNDRGTNNTLYHQIHNVTQDGQIQDKTPWNTTTPNATNWTGTGLGFGILASTATKNESWWGTANTCNDTTQLYAGMPTTDTPIMQHDAYSNTQTDTTICYKLVIPSTQLSGEYTGSVTYTAAGRP